MNSEKVISNIKKAIKEHLDNNYAYDMLVDFELDVIDWNSLFEYIDKLQQENEQLKDKLSKIETLIIKHNCDTGEIYYKYNSKFLKSELKQRILEIVYEQRGDSDEV